MKIIVPITIDPTTQVTSNLSDLFAAWSSATTYATGNRVTYNARTYESLINSNLNIVPGSDPTKWLDIGPSNKTAAFDVSNSTLSERNSPIEITITPSMLVNSIALINITNGGTATVEVRDSLSAVVYTKTIVLDGSLVGDWYDYFFAPFDALQDAIFTDLPPYVNCTIKVTIVGSNPVKIGTIIVGNVNEIGSTQYGVSFGIRDYSLKQEDDFGNTIFVVRNFARRVEPTVFIENGQLRKIDKLLTDIRAKPTVFIPTEIDGYEPLITFGYLKDWNIEIPYPNHSLLRLEIQGLT